MSSCRFPGCGRDIQAVGLCCGHYKQHNLGKPLKPLRVIRPAWADPTIAYQESPCPALGSPCHVFSGGTNGHGYGAVRCDGRMIGAHVYVWMRANGAVPKGLMIDHRCRNRRCCNIEHLRLVTNRTNSLENSESFAAANAAKTHCPKGHPYSGENLITESNGRRKCRACTRRKERERYATRRSRVCCDGSRGV